MTKVDMILEEEKREAVNKAVNKAIEDTTREVTETVTATVTATVTDEVSSRIAVNFLLDGATVEEVARNTGLDESRVAELKEKIGADAKDGGGTEGR